MIVIVYLIIYNFYENLQIDQRKILESCCQKLFFNIESDYLLIIFNFNNEIS